MFELFQDVFQIRTPADALVAFIDITIVSYLIYRVLLLIRGTKAVPILFGLLLIIVGFFISKDEYFGFSAFNWVLDKFIAAFILLVIVSIHLSIVGFMLSVDSVIVTVPTSTSRSLSL